MPEDAFVLYATGPSKGVLLLKALAVMGIVLLLMSLRGILTWFSGVLVAALMGLYVIIDYLYWEQKGIRSIAVNAETVTLWKGRSRTMQQIARDRITAIGVYRKMSLVRVVFFLGGGPLKVMPGFTYFTGPRIMVTNEYFDSGAFKNLLTALEQYGYPIQYQ
ncbi:MAG: hypothetical protein WHT81_02875 [Rectinemataceae bacterium]|nr:hypothetical protein [Spirochaetaceae bacterium]